MTTLVDEKYRVLAAATGLALAIRDMEVAYLQGLIVAPIISDQLNDLWNQYLTEQGFGGDNFNDNAFAWLGSLGRTGSLKDRWFEHWSAL